MARGDVVPASQDDPFVRDVSTILGGPVGRHARLGTRWWTPLRILIGLVLITMALGFAQKSACRNIPWTGEQYTRACYTDIMPLYAGRGFDKPGLPYIDHPLEYPVGVGAVMEVAAVLVKPFDVADRAWRFYDVTWVILTICAVIAVVATALTHRRRPWDAALLALAPGLLFTGTINWDLLPLALTALSMLAWSRHRPGWAGVFLGLAVATKFYPVVLLGPLFLLCWRAGRMRAFWTALGGAALAWAVVDVPVWIRTPSGFGWFYAFSQERGIDLGSPYLVANLLGGYHLTTDQWNKLAIIAFAVLCVGVAYVALRAPQRPRLPQLFLLVSLAFLVTNKVYSPQYVLWLIPLVALARPRWRTFLVWQAAELLYFFAVWYYLEQSLPVEWYAAAVSLRIAAQVWLAAVVIRDIWRPAHDPVRANGADDPAGGVLDGAPDAPLWQLRRTPAPSERAPA